jgi:hypothetical protein
MDLYPRSNKLTQPFSNFQVTAGSIEMVFRYKAEDRLTMGEVDLLEILVLNPLYYDAKCARLRLPLTKYNP